MKANADASELVVPRSVAVIMDGNGRWARKAGLERIFGHERGVEAVRSTVTECARLGVQALTLYAFSEENWQRPEREVKLLFGLLEKFLTRELPTLVQHRVRLLHAGRRERIPRQVLQLLDETCNKTASHDGLQLCLAISYGGRQEIVDAVRKIAQRVARGELPAEAITEQSIHDGLYQPQLPDPDLMIRTAGEMRISNFLLWQVSYSELHVCDVCWPEFGVEHLHAAFRDYGRRVRKFGKVR